MNSHATYLYHKEFIALKKKSHFCLLFSLVKCSYKITLNSKKRLYNLKNIFQNQEFFVGVKMCV